MGSRKVPRMSEVPTRATGSIVRAGALLAALCSSAACGPDRTMGFDRPDATSDATSSGEGGAGMPDGARGDGSMSTDASNGDIVPIPVDGSMGGGGMDMTIVYAHSGRELFRFDPRENPPAVRRIGMLTYAPGTPGVDAGSGPSLTDLAVDREGRVVGVSRDALFRVNPTTAECTRIAMLPTDSLYVALTYIPAGERDPANEVLVGGTREGELFEINPETGRTTRIAKLSDNWEISGDFVSVAGAGTYVTVRRTTRDESDRLALVNLSNGRLTFVGSSSATIGFGSIYGLGYWRATVFGFTLAGEFIRINTSTGRGTLVNEPGVMGGFAGAGSTTIAPTGPG